MKVQMYAQVIKIGSIIENKTNSDYDEKIINFSSLETLKRYAIKVPKWLFPKTDDLLLGSQVKIEFSIDYFTSKDDNSIVYNYLKLDSIKLI